MHTHLSKPALIFLAAFFGMSTPVLFAADGPSLGKYVPSAVHLYSGWKDTEETRKAMEPLFRAGKKLADSGIGRDIFELVTIEMSGSERERARTRLREIFSLVGTVEWKTLLQSEGAFALRFAIVPECLLALRVGADSAPQRQSELRELLEKIAGHAPDSLVVTQSERLGARVSTLRVRSVPIGLSVAVKGDVVVLGTSGTLLDDLLRRMDLDDARGSIVDDPRYTQAMDGLVTASSVSETFFDLTGYFALLRGLLGMAAVATRDDPGAATALQLASKVLDEISKIQNVAGTERLEGGRYYADGRIALEASAGPGFIEQLIADQKPVSDYARAIPADALGFYVSAGVRPATIFDAMIDLVRQMPDGDEVLEELGEVQERIGIDVREDLLAWVDGGFGHVSLPPRSPGECPQTVCFLRLTDSEKARQVLGEIWKLASSHIESRGHDVRLVDIAAGLRQLEIDALPWCRPVFGLPGDVFVVASSTDAARRVRAAMNGDSPSILENPRFNVLGAPPQGGQLCEVYYQDIEGQLRGVANLLGTLGFVASLLPEEGDTRPVIKAGVIATKLAAFLRDIDLAIDYSGWTQYDPEKHELRFRHMVGFRE